MPRAFLMSTKNKLKNVKTDSPTLERAKDKTLRKICDGRRADEKQETSTIDLARFKEESVATKYVNETKMKKGKFSTCSVIGSNSSNPGKTIYCIML